MYLFIYLFIYLSVSISFYLSVCLSICLFICACLSVDLFISVCLSVCLHVHLYINICTLFDLSILFLHFCMIFTALCLQAEKFGKVNLVFPKMDKYDRKSCDWTIRPAQVLY